MGLRAEVAGSFDIFVRTGVVFFFVFARTGSKSSSSPLALSSPTSLSSLSSSLTVTEDENKSDLLSRSMVARSRDLVCGFWMILVSKNKFCLAIVMCVEQLLSDVYNIKHVAKDI